jgi:hypothetical protein
MPGRQPGLDRILAGRPYTGRSVLSDRSWRSFAVCLSASTERLKSRRAV